MVDERSILQGLMQRGIPAHIAQGFVMNMRDESGLNPGINEVAPLVPGSRGGFGLYQLTGPRRTAYEQFAGSRGVDPANVDAQLDFLVSELQGPESRAAQSIFATQDVPSAAAAIARDFLRPAPENLQKRVAQYTGGTAMQPQGLLGTVSTQGQEPEQLPFFQRPGTADLLDTLAIGFSGMSMRPNQALIQSAQERIKGRRESAQTAKQRNATAAWLRSQGREDLASALESGGIKASDAVAMSYQRPEDPRTALQKNYEFFLAQGMTPEQAMSAVRSGTTINMPGAPTIGTIPPGYQAVQDPQTGRFTFEPIEGGPAAIEAETRAGQKSALASTAQDSIRLIDSVINDPSLGSVTGMFQGRLPAVTQSGTDLVTKIEQIQGQAFLQAFESLKGGGAITEREGIAAQNAIANLNRAQSEKAFKDSLKALRDIVDRGRRRAAGENIPDGGGNDGIVVGDPY